MPPQEFDQIPWSSVEHSEFTDAIPNVIGGFHRWEEAREGRDWVLERSPREAGTYNERTGLYSIVIEVRDNDPPKLVVIDYEVDETRRLIIYRRLRNLYP